MHDDPAPDPSDDALPDEKTAILAPATEIPGAQETGLIGRYQLCYELASGGMARVYLARVAGVGGFEKLVALKRIHPHLAEHTEFVDMFLDEARIASRVDHPNVCTVFDFGHAGGEYFIAMEYLLGETLQRVWRHVLRDPELARSPRWYTLALRIIAEACEGLHAAHELRGDDGALLEVVHRDVSPANIFVTYEGAVKIVDFGVARAADRLHTTTTGQVKGRFAYMALEQARNQGVDRRADVWSLGVVLWELLTGMRLFDRDNDATTMMAVLEGNIPAPSVVRPGLPPVLDEVVLRALRADRTERYASAREMGRALERTLTKLGATVGKVELADLMALEFESEREAREQMIVEARRMQAGRVLKAPQDSAKAVPPVPALSDDDARRAGTRSPRAAGDLEQDADLRRTPIATLPVIDGAARRRRRLALGLAATVVAGAGALTAFGSLGGSSAAHDPAPSAATSLPAIVPVAVGTPASPRPAPSVEPASPPSPDGPSPAPDAEPTAAPRPDATPELARDVPAPPSDARTAPRAPRAPRVTASRDVRASAEPAFVNVATPGGWADLYLRGAKVGRSPTRLTLPPGRHVIDLRPFGTQPPQRATVTAASGETARVSVPVHP
jgi:serine/threonine-protein kinase